LTKDKGHVPYGKHVVALYKEAYAKDGTQEYPATKHLYQPDFQGKLASHKAGILLPTFC
jgi:hypothetical protein